MQPHHEREHAQWSASSTAANWACPGRLTLIEQLSLPEKESEAAAWGTAAHSVSEKCLRSGQDAADFIGTVEKTKQHEIEVDDELAECAQIYIDYCRSRPADKHWIEQKFSLAKLNTPFEAGGTGDFVVYNATARNLEVVDLKGGRGIVVEAKGNPQLRTYALGAMLANPGLDVEGVTVTIVQPRAGHKDGRIRSETFHVADLLDWTTDLLAAMRRSAAARDAYNAALAAPWAVLWLNAGDHCKFCPAAATCPALEQKALDAVGVWFDDLDRPQISNAPDRLSPEELSKRLDLLDMIEDWISATRAHAHTLAEMGTDIPEYGLVDKVGRRTWAADEDKVASDLKTVVGLTDDQIYARKLRTPAQIETVLKKRKGEIASMWHTPVKGTNLVRKDKTSRLPATPAVAKHFSPIED